MAILSVHRACRTVKLMIALFKDAIRVMTLPEFFCLAGFSQIPFVFICLKEVTSYFFERLYRRVKRCGALNKCHALHQVGMKTYVINLTRRRDRLRAMSAQLSRMGLSFERVPALDAGDIHETWLKQYFENNGPLGPIPKGDQCCSLSHRRAWSAFLASNAPYAVILEDDVLLDDAAADLLQRSDWLPPDVRVVKLEHFGPEKQRVLLGTPAEVRRGWQIAPIHSRHTGAGAYVLSRQAAETLLARNGKWSVPVDHLLFNPNVSDVAVQLRPYQLLPAIARQMSSFGGTSDIRQWRLAYRRPSLALAKREIIRAYYELRLLPEQILRLLSGQASLIRVGNERLTDWKPLLPDEAAPRARGGATSL